MLFLSVKNVFLLLPKNSIFQKSVALDTEMRQQANKQSTQNHFTLKKDCVAKIVALLVAKNAFAKICIEMMAKVLCPCSVSKICFNRASLKI